MQNVIVVSLTVCTHVVGPKNWGMLGPAPWVRGVADPQKHATPHVLAHQISSLKVKPLWRKDSIKVWRHWGPAPLG